MEECKKHKINQKAGNFGNQNPDCPDFSSGISGHPTRNIRNNIRSIRINPESPGEIPEYPVTLMMFHPDPIPNT